jgi:hypothetical protein
MTQRLSNHLLHELNLRAHGGVPAVCKQANVWFPHIYACLRGEKVISVVLLEKLGDALGMELVWRRVRHKKGECNDHQI